MLLTIMMAAQFGPSTTITAEVEPPEWERVRRVLVAVSSPLAVFPSRSAQVPERSLIESKGAQPLLNYRFDTDISTSTDPGSGKLKLNHATQPNATFLSFDRLTNDGMDVTMLLDMTDAAEQFVIHDKDLALKYQIWKKAGAVVDRTDWFQVPVAYVSGTTTFTQNQPLLVLTKSYDTFIGLFDTPWSYVGAAGQVVSVRADEAGLEFTEPSGSGSPSPAPTPSGPMPWMQCMDPKTKWTYLLNMAEVVRIGPAHADEAR